MNTVWKEIPGYEGRYLVSRRGDVISVCTSRPKRIKACPSKNGYKVVNLADGKGGMHTYTIHRLLAMAFVPGGDPKLVVDHVNGDKDDNRVNNLEWVTQKENLRRFRASREASQAQ